MFRRDEVMNKLTHGFAPMGKHATGAHQGNKDGSKRGLKVTNHILSVGRCALIEVVPTALYTKFQCTSPNWPAGFST